MTDEVGKLNGAIHECLERCYCARSPLACMAEYLAELKQDPMWTMAELHTVEKHVRQILTLIVQQPPAGRISA